MNQNIFCSKCHRIPNQCCCSSAKELTDEEIYKVWKKAMQEEAKIEYSIYATQLERQPFVFFARAILKKAREQ